MGKKNFPAKTAKGLRRAEQSSPVAVKEAASAPQLQPVIQLAPQEKQSPRGRSNEAWANLHPERIWPD